MLHKHLTESEVYTKDAMAAKVFFIPVYLGRFFNAQWQRFSDPSDAWLINKECHGLDLVDCWAEKWVVAENVSTYCPPILKLAQTSVDCLCILDTFKFDFFHYQ